MLERSGDPDLLAGGPEDPFLLRQLRLRDDRFATPTEATLSVVSRNHGVVVGE
jgi:hypothetical protein